MESQKAEVEVSDKILTIPNVISFCRLCLVPVFLCLLIGGNNAAACGVFALAACTDFVDGQIARRTNCVTKLGQLLDPLVDRCLVISAVIGLLVVGRLPAWIVIVVLARDLFLLAGGYYLLEKWHVRVPVVYAGKFAATLVYVGFAALLLNYPVMQGLGITTISWLPGFNSDSYGWGIWLVYAGVFLNIFTTIHYIRDGWNRLQAAKAERLGSDNEDDAGR